MSCAGHDRLDRRTGRNGIGCELEEVLAGASVEADPIERTGCLGPRLIPQQAWRRR